MVRLGEELKCSGICQQGSRLLTGETCQELGSALNQLKEVKYGII